MKACSAHLEQVKPEQWPVLIRDHHSAYISFEHYLANQVRLQGNAMMKRSEARAAEQGPAREGSGLLQGLVMCGNCGRRMGLSYGGHRRSRVYQYRCFRARQEQGGPDCQTIGGKRIDQAVVEVFLEAISPCALDAARLANEEARREREALRLYWAHQIEKARYEAQRAERQYLAVEPKNCVVARELERRGEQALQELERVRHEG